MEVTKEGPIITAIPSKTQHDTIRRAPYFMHYLHQRREYEIEANVLKFYKSSVEEYFYVTCLIPPEIVLRLLRCHGSDTSHKALYTH
jgi:hypothetical protein